MRAASERLQRRLQLPPAPRSRAPALRPAPPPTHPPCRRPASARGRPEATQVRAHGGRGAGGWGGWAAEGERACCAAWLGQQPPRCQDQKLRASTAGPHPPHAPAGGHHCDGQCEDCHPGGCSVGGMWWGAQGMCWVGGLRARWRDSLGAPAAACPACPRPCLTAALSPPPLLSSPQRPNTGAVHGTLTPGELRDKGYRRLRDEEEAQALWSFWCARLPAAGCASACACLPACRLLAAGCWRGACCSLRPVPCPPHPRASNPPPPHPGMATAGTTACTETTALRPPAPPASATAACTC